MGKFPSLELLLLSKKLPNVSNHGRHFINYFLSAGFRWSFCVQVCTFTFTLWYWSKQYDPDDKIPE